MWVSVPMTFLWSFKEQKLKSVVGLWEKGHTGPRCVEAFSLFCRFHLWRWTPVLPFMLVHFEHMDPHTTQRKHENLNSYVIELNVFFKIKQSDWKWITACWSHSKSNQIHKYMRIKSLKLWEEKYKIRRETTFHKNKVGNLLL